MNQNADPGEPMLYRARKVAVGFADVGLTHAEEMLRRLSPEGREQARREREAKARRHKRLMIRLVMAAIASLLAWALLAALVAPAIALAAAAALMLLLTLLVFLRAERPGRGREALAEASLAGLTEEATAWLAAQRRGLPPPALTLSESLCGRLDALAPELARLDPRSPAAAGVRRLVAEELPDLVEGWRSVPFSARNAPRADGRTPDDHLVNGLALIDAELGRVGEQLEGGAVREVAVMGRYLELKYDAGGGVLPRA